MDDASLLASNLRRARAARGLSLSDLARRAGVAKATLVAIEAGRGNPTLSTLRALADELAVPLEQLVSDATAPTFAVGRAGGGGVLRGVGADVRFLRRSHAGGATLELYALTVHGPQESAPHPSGVLEQIVVTGGRLLVEVGDARVDLGPGDVVAFSADRPHRYDALDGGEASGVMLMTYPDLPGPIWAASGPALPPASAP